MNLKKIGEYTQSGSKFNFLFELYNDEEIDIILKYKIQNSEIFELYRF